MILLPLLRLLSLLLLLLKTSTNKITFLKNINHIYSKNLELKIANIRPCINYKIIKYITIRIVIVYCFSTIFDLFGKNIFFTITNEDIPLKTLLSKVLHSYLFRVDLIVAHIHNVLQCVKVVRLKSKYDLFRWAT